MANLIPDPWIPAAGPFGWDAAALAVYRVGTDGTTLTSLPNVDCLAVQEHEGPAPSTAVFRYVFDGLDSEGPQTTEEALSTAFTGLHVVEVNDRLAVRATRPDGTLEWLFYGVAVTWSGTLDGGHEAVIIHATGIEKTCWDTPIGGALVRNSPAPETVSDVPTALVARFNPDGRDNASPSTADAGSTGATYPTFLDPDRTGTDTGGIDYPRTWTLALAAAHLIFVNNTAGLVSNPTRSDLDALLIGREPIDGTPFDVTNPSSYTAKAIAAADAPLTGRPWPVALHDQVSDYGFGMRFEVNDDGAGHPKSSLKLWLKQAATVKSLYLAARSTANLDTGATNVERADLGRDLAGVVNRWVVDGALDRWEVSFVLAPGFPSQASDCATAGALSIYDKGDPAFATSSARDAYRLYVLDESGTGHYAPASTTKLTTATSLDAVLGAPAGGVPKYVTKDRAPKGELFYQNADGEPIRARLAISTDFAPASAGAPSVWDGTGTWRHVTGGWELLPNRVGIRINVKNPNGWQIGDSQNDPFQSGVVKAVACVAAPDADNPPFWLRLTCVIEADQGLTGVADTLGTSPVDRVIESRVDARDRYSVRKRYYPSEFNNSGGGSTDTVRDDTELAKAEAVALRTATDSGVMEGEITIPYLTRYYQVGDRIDQVVGRGLGLRTDAGGTDYDPVFPVVVGRRFDLDGGQSTTLTLSDAGLDRRRHWTRPASRGGGSSASDRAAKARAVAKLAAQIQAAGFGVATGRF